MGFNRTQFIAAVSKSWQLCEFLATQSKCFIISAQRCHMLMKILINNTVKKGKLKKYIKLYATLLPSNAAIVKAASKAATSDL